MINEKIEKEGDKWAVKSEDGKTLGTHSTKEKAVDQLQAIEASKRKNEVKIDDPMDPQQYQDELFNAAIELERQRLGDNEEVYNSALWRLKHDEEFKKQAEQFAKKKLREREDNLDGGLGDEASPNEFNKDQVLQGIKVEFEHTDDFETALEIALDHLEEDPQYYSKLSKIEPQHDLDEMSAMGGGAVQGSMTPKKSRDDDPWTKGKEYTLEELFESYWRDN